MQHPSLTQAGLRDSGIDVIGSVPWGTHFCQFYRTKQDLIDVLVPYFKAGLENNEFCVWVTAEPLVRAEARDAISRAVPGFEEYLRQGQIEIIPHDEWYLFGGAFDADRVLNGWVSKLEQALARGYSGLRLTGNTFWLERNGWHGFTNYEAAVNSVIGQYKIVALCTYCLDKCDGSAVLDVVKNHQFALIKQAGRWDIIESAIFRQARDSQAELATILASVPVLMLVVDSERRVLKVNEAAARFCGRRAEEMLGLRGGEALGCLHALDDPSGCGSGPACQTCNVRLSVLDTFETGRSHYQVEWNIPMMRDGRTEDVAGLASTVLIPGPRKQVLLCIEDITERKRAEEALILEKRVLEAVKENTGAHLAYLDPEFNFVTVNSAYARGSGHTIEELVGKNHFTLFPDQENRAIFQSVRDTGETASFHDKPFVFADQPDRGVTYWDWTLVAVKDSAGKVEGLVLSLMDTTERVRYQQQRERFVTEVAGLNETLERKTVELEAANRELEAFAYSVSHDLRAPLRSLSGFSDALVEDYGDRLDETGKQHLQWIKESSVLMAQLIDDLLKLSRLTRDEMVWERADLSDIARAEIEKLKESDRKRKVECVIAPGLVCQGDARLLSVMLGNLLSNAWKFTSKVASPRIEVGITQSDGAPEYFVRDNGAGFDKAYADKLFRPFYRLHKASEYPGTGIGLAIVHRIVQRHGGRIWADSRPGQGATFYFTLR